MRITIVTGFFLPVPPIKGGATERSWHQLAILFAQDGHAVTMVSRTDPDLPTAETNRGVRHLRLSGFDHSRNIVWNVFLDFLWGLRVQRSLPSSDVVICNTIALPAWLPGMRQKIGKVVVMIGRTPKGQVSLYRSVSRIYVPSSAIAARIRQPWAKSLTKVTGYPIDCTMHASAIIKGRQPLTLAYVGRIHPEKGIELLLAACHILTDEPNLPSWRLKIVGPVERQLGGGGAEWLESVQSRIPPNLGEHIVWHRAEFEAKSLAAIYGATDIFCYPSLSEHGETFGVAVAEAMAAHCAIVVSALPCFSDLVEDGRTGLVFDHRVANPEQQLAGCIRRLITDLQLRTMLSENGAQKSNYFDKRNVSTRILDDLRELVASG